MSKTKSSDKSLFDNLKGTLSESPVTPIQQVAPIARMGAKANNKKVEEAPFTLYMPTTLLRNLKVKAATEGGSIKELINNAIINQYNFK